MYIIIYRGEIICYQQHAWQVKKYLSKIKKIDLPDWKVYMEVESKAFFR